MSTPEDNQGNHAVVHERIDKMTRALRVLGAVLLLTSASSFLVHKWDGGQDLLRFGFLLCHSFVILGAALFCGGKLGESRSARVFLWTNLAMIPAHFAVLGGLVYSQFSLDSATLNLPAYAVWEAPNPSSVLLATVGTYVTVLSTGLISARVLAPRRGRNVILLFVGLCSLLLIPLRNSNAAAGLAAAGAIVALVFDRKALATDFRMRTLEGKMVRSLLSVPSTLLVTRAAVFYPITDIFTGVLILVGAVIAFVWVQTIENNRASVEAGEWLATLGACVGVVFILSGTGIFESVGILSLSSCSVVMLLASRFSQRGRSGFEVGSAVSAVTVATLSLGLDSDLASGLCALIAGAAALSYSILMGRVLVGASAAFCTLGGIAVVFDEVIGLEHLGSWGALSILGVLAVLSAAVLERHRDAILTGVLRRFASEKKTHDVLLEAPTPEQIEFSPSTPATPG